MIECGSDGSTGRSEFWIRIPEVGVVCGDTEFFGMKTGRYLAGPFELEQLLEQNCILSASALYRRCGLGAERRLR